MIAIRKRMLTNAFLITAFSLLPIYTGASGGIQISHALLAIYLGGFILLKGWTQRALETVLFCLFFIVLFREAFSVFNGAQAKALLPAVYLLFNIILVHVVSRVSLHEDGVRALKTGFFLAATVAALGVLVFGYGFRGGVNRAVGTFNNPNQLGYFSVCLISIILLLRLSKNLSIFALLGGIFASLFLAMTSLSKAAMISVSFAVLFSSFIMVRHRLALFVGMALLIVLIIGSYQLYESGYLDGFSFFHRIEDIGQQSDDSFKGRGYLNLGENSVTELLVGMGSVRSQDVIGHEVHSTIFYYFVNYGILGGTFFLAVLALWGLQVYQNFGINGLLMVVVPPMAYGITHNGGRFTMFWLLIAISFALDKRRLVQGRYNYLAGTYRLTNGYHT